MDVDMCFAARKGPKGEDEDFPQLPALLRLLGGLSPLELLLQRSLHEDPGRLEQRAGVDRPLKRLARLLLVRRDRELLRPSSRTHVRPRRGRRGSPATATLHYGNV